MQLHVSWAAVSLPCSQLPLTCVVFRRPFVKRFALCYQSVVCLSVCLSLTMIYCGQTVARMKMKLGMEVGLGPDHIVLDTDPAPPQGA